MARFKNKVAVTTGGNIGVGYATAKVLRSAEANVNITGRTKEALDTAAETLPFIISPPGASVYAASNPLFNVVVKTATPELGSRKIRVNSASAGSVATEIMNKLGLNKSAENQMISSIPLAMLGKSSEVANLIAFLLTKNASFITGSNFLIDGGK